MLGPQGATLMTLDGSDVELCAIDKFSDETIVIVYTTISAINSELYADILTTDGERILADPIRLHNVANDEKRYSSVSLHPLNNGREMVALFLCRMDNENGVSHQQVVMQKIDVDGDLLLGEEGIILSEEESDVRTFAVSQTPNDRFWIMAHVYDTEMAYLKIAEYTREGQLENVIDPIEPMDNLDEIKLEGDGQGGVYAFYRGITERWEDGDLYYYHFDREGNLVDPAYEGQGVPLSTAWYSQVDLVTASDGAGGVVTAWTDFRGSGGDIPEDDIYALRVNDFTVSADEKDNTTLPHQWAIESVYPNPFNPSTTITYTVPVQSTVNLLVFDILGQEVASLIKSNQLAGRYQVVWDGKSNSGVSVASGIYLVQLEAGGISLTSKLTLIK